MVQEWPQGISQESSQCYLKYEVGDILDEFWISAMWDILRFLIPSRIRSPLSYNICRYCRVGTRKKEVSLIKLHVHCDLILSHLWNWRYLLKFFQQGIPCESWREDVPKKSQRHSKGLWDFCIWDCRILFQEWKWTYDWNPGSEILCYRVTKGFVHHFTTRNLHIRRIQGYLHR